MARDGGVLVRAGHTEAAVDIARLAGLNPAGVICEIMNDDGTMARLPDLIAFAQLHGLKIGTIADLIAYRRRNERLVERVLEGTFDHAAGGECQLIVYANTVDYAEHIALVKGDLSAPEPVLVRMHAVNVLDDVTGGPHWIAVHNAMDMIAEAGRGAVVLIREHRADRALRPRAPARHGTPGHAELRDYGIGAQILLDLGVRDMVLLSNSARTIVGLEGYGLNVVETAPDQHHRPGQVSTEDAALPSAPRVEGPPPHLLLVRAPYYTQVVDGLTQGAERILRDAGATFETLDVAGAYELPQAIRLALRGARRFDGYVALGCVVKGETDHYDHICRETISGLMQVSLQFGLALGQGVLTVLGSTRPWPAPVRMGTTKGQRPRPRHWYRSMQPAG